MENLPEIKDIHIPDGVSIFPLAYGWWIILFGVIFAIVLIKLILLIIRTSKKFYALNTLKNISTDKPVLTAVSVSELLRRICILKYKNANALYGQSWIDFLNLHTKDKLSGNAAKLLEYAPYMDINTTDYTQTDAEKLKIFAKNWIGVNL